MSVVLGCMAVPSVNTARVVEADLVSDSEVRGSGLELSGFGFWRLGSVDITRVVDTDRVSDFGVQVSWVWFCSPDTGRETG